MMAYCNERRREFFKGEHETLDVSALHWTGSGLINDQQLQRKETKGINDHRALKTWQPELTTFNVEHCGN